MWCPQERQDALGLQLDREDESLLTQTKGCICGLRDSGALAPLWTGPLVYPELKLPPSSLGQIESQTGGEILSALSVLLPWMRASTCDSVS